MRWSGYEFDNSGQCYITFSSLLMFYANKLEYCAPGQPLKPRVNVIKLLMALIDEWAQ
jgi:hypothetical protein